MKNTDPIPRGTENSVEKEQTTTEQISKTKRKERTDKKKKKHNLWPLKAFVITFALAVAVNAASELALEDSRLWLACLLTVVILLLGVVFDIIGTAATACEIGPFHSMASRKVKGAKLAVKFAQKSDVVSSVCCDIVGDVCGIVSGVCAAAIASYTLNLQGSFWWSVLIYAIISTLTITLKAVGKGLAVKKANKIIFGVARMLSIFRKEG